MSTEHTVGIDIPPNDKGWKYTLSLPPVFAPGEVPYPIILEGPRIRDKGSGTDREWRCTTNIVKIDATLPEDEREKDYDFHTLGGAGYGPFEDGIAIILGSNIELNEPGIYRFYHILSLVDTVQGKEIKHASVESYIHQVDDKFKDPIVLFKDKSEYVKRFCDIRPDLKDHFDPYLHIDSREPPAS